MVFTIVTALLLTAVLGGGLTVGWLAWKKTESAIKATAGSISPSTLLFLSSQSGRFETSTLISKIIMTVVVIGGVILVILFASKLIRRIRK